MFLDQWRRPATMMAVSTDRQQQMIGRKPSEFFASDIEGEGLHHADIANRKLFEHDPSVADRREIVGGGPILGAILNAPINDVRLERFKCGGRIAELFVV
jgi:hypothetical protein